MKVIDKGVGCAKNEEKGLDKAMRLGEHGEKSMEEEEKEGARSRPEGEVRVYTADRCERRDAGRRCRFFSFLSLPSAAENSE